MISEKAERFLVEGYVVDIFPKVSPKTGNPYWVVSLDLAYAKDDEFDFEFVTYYEPVFVEGDLIRIGISRRDGNTISSCAPFIVERGNLS